MGEQLELEDMNQTQQSSWLVNNILFYYEGEKQTRSESKRKQHFLQHKGKHSNSKEPYTNGLKSRGRIEASIHTTEMTAIKMIEEKRT